MAWRPVTVNDLLDGQVGLDLECADRVYLNGYVPNLQVPGQVVLFLTRHLGNPIPSPALMDQIGQRFRRAVDSYAEANRVPVVRFVKGQRKVDVMRPLMALPRPPHGPRWSRSAWRRSTPGWPPRAPSSPDNGGTRRHFRMARVRLARRKGVREEPAF